MKAINKIFIVTLCASFILTACSKGDEEKKVEEVKEEEKDIIEEIYNCIVSGDTVEITEDEVTEALEDEGLDETSFIEDGEYLKVYTTIAEDEVEDGVDFTVNLVEEKDGYSGCYVTTSYHVLGEIDGKSVLFSYVSSYRESTDEFIFLISLNFITDDVTLTITYAYDEDSDTIVYEDGEEELDSKEFREEIVRPDLVFTYEIFMDKYDDIFGDYR